jgi:dihydroneopterin aldolase
MWLDRQKAKKDEKTTQTATYANIAKRQIYSARGRGCTLRERMCILEQSKVGCEEAK